MQVDYETERSEVTILAGTSGFEYETEVSILTKKNK